MPELLEDALSAWRECPSELPPFPRTFGPAEQAERERQLDRFLDGIQTELQRLPRTRADREAAHARITAAFVTFGRAAMEFTDAHLELLLGGGFSAVGTDLGKQARRFDPAVSAEDILQASRNAWTACGLEVLLGESMRLTPAIFAYSMLYPYTDNYLDDPAVSREAKHGFSVRFGKRLAGESVEATNAHEDAIWRLVGLIEGQYPRAASPAVFASLLRIHSAQENSIRLLRQGTSAADCDVLRLSFEKGGSSVLADGYLAAGALTAVQSRFIFDWGVLLQLADDLQDVQQDCRDGVLTVFSQAAPNEKLDAITARTLQFGGRVMLELRALPAPDCAALEDLIARSATSMLIRSAGEAPELYSAAFLAELERHSPFRFEFLSARRKQFARRSGLLVRLFEAFLEGDDDEAAFPLLPGALMPRL